MILIYVLYFIWFALPLTFFLLALYAKLEQMSKSPKKQKTAEFIGQGFFTLFCAIVTVLINIYLLEPNHEKIFPSFISLGFVQILLFPVVLTIGAKLIGGTKNVSISKTTHVTKRERR